MDTVRYPSVLEEVDGMALEDCAWLEWHWSGGPPPGPRHVRPTRRKGPTPHQWAAWEAVLRTGSQSAAARELGKHQSSIYVAVVRFMQTMGITGEIPSSRAARRPHCPGCPDHRHAPLVVQARPRPAP